MPTAKPAQADKSSKSAAGTKKVAPKGKRRKRSNPAVAEMIAGLKDLVETMKAGGMAAVEKKFRVTRYKPLGPPATTAAQVVAVRDALGVSQAVFAAWLGVSASTVQGWEQGVNPPAGAAARLIAEIRHDPAYWRKRLAAEMTAAG
jgi:putative transcriptional regulator